MIYPTRWKPHAGNPQGIIIPYPLVINKGQKITHLIPPPIRVTNLHGATMWWWIYIHIHCHHHESKETMRVSPRGHSQWIIWHVSSTTNPTKTNPHPSTSISKQLDSRDNKSWSGAVVSCHTVKPCQAYPYPSNKEGTLFCMAQINKLTN